MVAERVTTLAAFAPTPITQAIYQGTLTSLSTHASHEHASVLFADISGFTRMTEELALHSTDGSEELTGLLNNYFTHMIALLEGYGGQVVKFSGDAITALFWPSPPDGHTHQEAYVNAVLRAAGAAVAMQQAMKHFQHQPTSIGEATLQLRVSVGAGAVMTAYVGGVFNRWEYVIAGDAMAQAVQAQDRADPGMVVLAPQAAALVGASNEQGQASVVWSTDATREVGSDNRLPFAQPTPVPAPSFRWNTLLPDQLEQAYTLLRAFVPAAIATRLEAGQHAWLAELRRMTVMFVRVGDIDYSQDNALALLHSFVILAQEAAYRYEGSLNKVLVDDKGTLLLLLFGAPPLAHEDDPLRALACAREILSVASHGVDYQLSESASSERRLASIALPVAIGITTDTVFAGPVGSPTRREYTVMGDAVNLAARLMQIAQAGEALCDDTTYLEARSHWNLEPLPLLAIKGLSRAVHTYRFSGLRARSVLGDDKPLVGRSTELTSLLDYAYQVQQGTGRIVSLVGEGGMGKTRLLNEITIVLRERGLILSSIQGEAESIGQQTPYGIWRDALMDYFGLDFLHTDEQRINRVRERLHAIDPDLEARLPLLNAILDLDIPDTAVTRALGPRQRRDSLSSLVVQLFISRALEGPLLVVLDDMHWADSLSWDLALDVARSIALRPVLLLLGYRPLEVAVDALDREAVARQLHTVRQHHRVELLPLTTEAVSQLAATALNNAPVDPVLITWLTERSQGNPLFVEETVRTLREQDALVQGANNTWHFAGDQHLHAIPPTLKGVIQTRLDRLEPGTQLICKVASVIGRVFSERVVAGVYPVPHEVPRLPQRLERLANMDITPLESYNPEPRYHFKSALMQEVAYSSLLLTQRRALHQAVASWYEQEYAADLDAYFPLLADHYSHTEEWTRYLHFAEHAGRQAAERYATAEALNYLSKAIGVLYAHPGLLPPDEHQRRLFDLLLVRSEVYSNSSHYALQEQDLHALHDIADRSEDAHKLALIQTQWAKYYQTINNYAASEQAARAALVLAQQSGDRRLMGESMNRLARVAELRADYRKALWWGFKALGDCRLAKDHSGEARSMHFLGIAYAELGNYQKATRYYEQSLELCRTIEHRWGEADSLSRLGSLAENLGQPRQALTLHAETLTIRRSVGDRSGEADTLRSIGNVYQSLGDLSQTQRFFSEALGILRILDNKYGEAVLLVNMSSTASELGDFEAARSYARRAVELAHTLGNRQVEAIGLDVLGNANRGLDDAVAAREQHTMAYRLAHELGLKRWEAYASHHLGEWEWVYGSYEQAHGHWMAAAEVRAELGELELAHASRIRQAHALIMLGQYNEAHALIEPIWEAWGLMPPPSEDEDELREGYLSLYLIWQELGLPERASTALAWAYQAVHDRAGRISDPDIRQSFFSRVVINREILDTWEASQARE